MAALLVAELRRELKRRWSYRFNALGWYAMWFVIFPMMMVIFDRVTGNYGAVRRAESLVGFLVWDLCIMGGMAGLAQELAREAREGTLESVLLSPWTARQLFGARVAAALLSQGAETLLLGTLLAVLLRPSLQFSWTGMAVLGLMLLGVAGVSLALAGLTLVVKQVEGVVGLVGLLAVLFTGALAPLPGLERVFVTIKWLVPTAWGIEALRAAWVHGASWAALAQHGVWWGLAIQGWAWLLAGRVVLERSMRRAQREGSLGGY